MGAPRTHEHVLAGLASLEQLDHEIAQAVSAASTLGMNTYLIDLFNGMQVCLAKIKFNLQVAKDITEPL